MANALGLPLVSIGDVQRLSHCTPYPDTEAILVWFRRKKAIWNWWRQLYIAGIFEHWASVPCLSGWDTRIHEKKLISDNTIQVMQEVKSGCGWDTIMWGCPVSLQLEEVERCHGSSFLSALPTHQKYSMVSGPQPQTMMLLCHRLYTHEWSCGKSCVWSIPGGSCSRHFFLFMHQDLVILSKGHWPGCCI